jgi:hypothetical protein
MHLAARALLLALAPSVAAAQGETRYPATQQAQPHPAAAVDAGRYLVVACPTHDGVAATGPGLASAPTDSATRALVAALCARAESPLVLQTSSVEPQDVPEPALELLMRLAEAPAGSAPTLPVPVAPQRRSRHSGHVEHPAHSDRTGHDDPPNDALRSADERIAAEEPALPFTPQFRVHLFADVKYSALDSVGSRNGFALGQFDLFGRSELSDVVSVITEATLTALPRNTFSARLERLMLTYSPSEYVAASVGRYHTGIGYYNTAYHHGTWFQTATGRPLIFAIDGDIGVIPTHTLGLSATGSIPSGALGLHYVAELGSGRAGQSSAATAPQPVLADNNTPSVNLGLSLRPEPFDGLQLGLSVYRDRLTLQDTSKAPIDETVAVAHVVYKTEVLELMSEGLLMRHDPRSTAATNDSRGYYAQASRRLGSVRPYLRFDYLDIPKTNQLFGFLGRRSGPTVGVRYDFQALAALKLQTSHLTQTTRPTMNRFDAQVSFMF